MGKLCNSPYELSIYLMYTCIVIYTQRTCSMHPIYMWEYTGGMINDIYATMYKNMHKVAYKHTYAHLTQYTTNMA